jgi:hypothetical protein
MKVTANLHLNKAQVPRVINRFRNKERDHDQRKEKETI